MEEKLSSVAKTLTPSPIQELSLLAQRCNAVNLAEGFPDFPAPSHIKSAAVSAINSDFNQYRHVQGVCDHVAMIMKHMHGLDVDPLSNIAICCGQSEAFAATVFAIIDKGDEVILFDPSYETYEACIKLAGGIPVYVPLDPPCWTLDADKLMKSVTNRTKAIVLNSPHNPTGKVFTEDELETIAGACHTRDCLAITDEVYENITYDKEKHISLASLPGMQKRTIITSSLSKSYSVTGMVYYFTYQDLHSTAALVGRSHILPKSCWRISTNKQFLHMLIFISAVCQHGCVLSGWRIGWAIGPACIVSAIRNIHIKITDSAPAPFQEAALTALRSPLEYFEWLRRDYESRRDYTIKLLAGVGFQVQFKPQGSFFLFVELPENCVLSDVAFVEELIKQAEVVAVPGCGFFS
ncbi:hypothetical protein Acr_13g0000800 [Actinidia rufa]|uniref:Aminotransferase class I/classII large domain-containing protein n=1 Tax=Actinidia rufa TaxID=165716 RepID=A0A7J0FKK2_9ERIC|nr:hypothetical protein Acr_13g0000800 [Actinidia rufa]